MKAILTIPILSLCVSVSALAEERWFTYIDETGKVRNLFLDDSFTDQQNEASSRISLSGYTSKVDSSDSIAWQANSRGVKEQARRYFSFIDGEGNLQSSFYSNVGASGPSSNDYVLGSGEWASSYMDAEALESKGFVRDGDGLPFFTWMDESGQMQTTSISPEQRALAFRQPQLPGLGAAPTLSDGYEIMIRRPQQLPATAAGPQLSNELSTVLDAGREQRRNNRTQNRDRQLIEDMRTGCCRSIDVTSFVPMGQGDEHFETFNSLSPSYAFPSGLSPYIGFVLPSDPGRLSVRIRSFAQADSPDFIYPTLLFLDAHREPVRMVTDAVYRLKPESWNSYASIEGVVQVKPWLGERYLVIMTTSKDRQQQTLDNRAYDRPLDGAVPNKDQELFVRQHATQGSFEVAFIEQ
ncbi:MalM family protein [Parendozoicomonas haliclonae]|uniref:Maltose regulon periplasmic protein n=1 Tax=Parendozoicomonas haliclonae TaxID=1960125 RepID=A0A1X7ALA8_9GAMM|nr:MalM family protein [Parendozoicomonas haliclonae]SMA48007.1 maltose regulon periplasmic protein [Parendozoicomonas haliclonae]